MRLIEKKLCPKGKAAAKRKFSVYPSAYANMYASAVCSGKVKPGGKKKKVNEGYGELGGEPSVSGVGNFPSDKKILSANDKARAKKNANARKRGTPVKLKEIKATPTPAARKKNPNARANKPANRAATIQGKLSARIQSREDYPEGSPLRSGGSSGVDQGRVSKLRKIIGESSTGKKRLTRVALAQARKGNWEGRERKNRIRHYNAADSQARAGNKNAEEFKNNMENSRLTGINQRDLDGKDHIRTVNQARRRIESGVDQRRTYKLKNRDKKMTKR